MTDRLELALGRTCDRLRCENGMTLNLGKISKPRCYDRGPANYREVEPVSRPDIAIGDPPKVKADRAAYGLIDTSRLETFDFSNDRDRCLKSCRASVTTIGI